jgi:hypothetical protein
MTPLTIAVCTILVAFDFQNLLAWSRRKVLRPSERSSYDFTVIVPLFGHPRYFDGRNAFAQYRANVLVALEVTPSHMQAFADQLEAEGWRVCRLVLQRPNPAALMKAALASVRTTYALRLDADTHLEAGLERIVAAVSVSETDICSVKVEAELPRTAAAKLQALEYRIAMLSRALSPVADVRCLLHPEDRIAEPGHVARAPQAAAPLVGGRVPALLRERRPQPLAVAAADELHDPGRLRVRAVQVVEHDRLASPAARASARARGLCLRDLRLESPSPKPVASTSFSRAGWDGPAATGSAFAAAFRRRSGSACVSSESSAPPRRSLQRGGARDDGAQPPFGESRCMAASKWAGSVSTVAPGCSAVRLSSAAFASVAGRCSYVGKRVVVVVESVVTLHSIGS